MIYTLRFISPVDDTDDDNEECYDSDADNHVQQIQIRVRLQRNDRRHEL